MTFDNIIDLLRNLLDVLIVWFALYFILKSVRKNVKMVLLFKGILVIVGLKLVSELLGLATIGFLLDNVIQWGLLAVIIIFQPEIRSVLEHLGRSQLLGRHKTLTVDEREKVVYEISNSLIYLQKNMIGGLIIIERDDSLNDYIEKSKKIYADISADLLISVFFPNNPLHDGGVIIQGDKITSAGAVFPVSDSVKISKRLGTRHRAALGISETTDSIAIVVSEETGRISMAVDGELTYNLNLDEFKLRLLEELRPKKESIIEEEVNEEDNEDTQ